MSMGIPSTTLGGGGRDAFTHAMNEWYEPLRSHEGPQLCLLTTLALVGVEGGPEPMLKLYSGKRKRDAAGHTII